VEHAAALEPAPNQCQNCSAALTGPFCGFCGQRALRLDVSLRELLHEAVHEFVHLDGRILTTVRLLMLRPGHLTAEMLAGRRARYIPPIRLYLVCSLLFFLVLSALLPPPKATGPADVAQGRYLELTPGEQSFSASIKRGAARVASDPEKFKHDLWNRVPKAAFVLVPIFALLTMALLRRRVRFFVPHLYFALHFHSFVFLILIVLMLLGRATSESVGFWGTLLVPLYLIAAARTTFETGWFEAFWKSMMLLGIHTALCLGVVSTVIVLSVLSA
jgi:hypothetical protein